MTADLPPEPPVGSVVLDCNGRAWQRNRVAGDLWQASNYMPRTWAALHELSPTVTVIHVAAPPEPPHDSLVMDDGGSVWRWRGDAWGAATLPRSSWGDLVRRYGPVIVYRPEGAA